MEDNKILRIIYSIFVGVLLAIFVGVGINTFYPGPQQQSHLTIYVEKSSEEQVTQQQEYDRQDQEYTEKAKAYNRNVSIITLSVAVLLLVISLIYEKKIKVIADGVMLGGLFTLIYSIIRGFVSTDNRSVFIVVTVGLVAVLYIGYHRFVRSTKRHSRNR